MSDEPYTVQKFRGGFAIVYWEDGKRRRIQLEASDRQSAQAEARRKWATGDQSPWTVARVIDHYLKAKETEGIASIDRRRDAWKAMKGFWANVRPDLIDDEMCRAYHATRTVSDTTVRLELSLLSTAIGFAVEDKNVPEITAKPKMWLPPAGERKTRHLTPRQFKKLVGGVRAPHAKLYMYLGVFTLARPSALFDLRWSQVDFIRNMVDLNPPGRKQTAKKRPVVPMGPLLRAAMEEAFHGRSCEYVIERGGKRVGSLKKAFQAASERSGVHATPYTLRHTGAVWSAEQGTPMSELAQLMGHDDDRTTQKHYARYSPEHLRKASQRVEDAFNEEGEVRTEPSAPVPIKG